MCSPLLLKRVPVHYVLFSYGTDVLAQPRGRALGHGLGPCKWWLVLGLVVNWVLTYLCIMRGAESAGKAVWITMPLPYLLLFLLLVKAGPAGWRS